MTDDVGLEALKLLNVAQVAELLGGLSRKTIWRLIETERKRPGTGLESVKIGSRVLVPVEAIAEYKRRLRGAA